MPTVEQLLESSGILGSFVAYGDLECDGCDSFAHDPSFKHDAIWDLTAFHSIPPRSGDLCEYTYHELAYAVGVDPPHYPVPTIRQGFEFGWSLREREATLIHWKQGVFDAT